MQQDQLEEILRDRAKERVLHTFDVPKSLADVSDVKTISLVELTADEEIMATRRARNDVVRLGLELARESLRAVNGKPASTATVDGDKVWREMHPKVRQLVVQAYNYLHNPAPAEAEDFLNSRKSSVG